MLVRVAVFNAFRVWHSAAMTTAMKTPTLTTWYAVLANQCATTMIITIVTMLRRVPVVCDAACDQNNNYDGMV